MPEQPSNTPQGTGGITILKKMEDRADNSRKSIREVQQDFDNAVADLRRASERVSRENAYERFGAEPDICL
jgi:hypothetical protein